MRSPSTFFRISLATIVAFIVITASFTTTHSQGGVATQSGTAAATSDGGAYPPCPAAIVTVATPASTSAATVVATLPATAGPTATATMTPSATMFVSTAQAPADGCQLVVNNLTGTAEVPGPGATGGGTVTLTITRPASGPGQICFDISVGGAQIKLPATGANLYMGAAKATGPMVVPFKAPDVNGRAIGCTQNVDRTLIKQIMTHPDQFYINILTSDFANGAVRGQLGTPVSYPPGQ